MAFLFRSAVIGMVFLAVQMTWGQMARAQMPSATGTAADAGLTIPNIAAFDDWQVVCAQDACRAEPRAAGSPLLSLSVVRDADANVLVLRGPLGLLLGEGIAVEVDGRSVGRLAFLSCEVDGCVAPVRLDGGLLRALRGGSNLTLGLFTHDGEAISANYSLIGFIAAMSALEQEMRGDPTAQ